MARTFINLGEQGSSYILQGGTPDAGSRHHRWLRTFRRRCQAIAEEEAQEMCRNIIVIIAWGASIEYTVFGLAEPKLEQGGAK